MTDTNIQKFRNLLLEAQHSYIIAASMVGNDSRVNRVLAKWPDLTDALLDYFESDSKDGYDKVISDLGTLVCHPMAIISLAMVPQLVKDDQNSYMEKISKIGPALWSSDPIRSKNKLIALINQMIDRGKVKCDKITAIKGDEDVGNN